MIKLKDFVDVNLTSVTPSSNEENKTVVYIYGNSGLSQLRLTKTLNASNYVTEMVSLDTVAKEFITQFFNLGGASLKVVCLQTATATSYDVVNSNNTLFINEVKNLPVEQVAVVVRQASEGIDEQSQYDATGYHYESYQIDSTNHNGLNEILDSIQAVVTEQGTAYRKLLVKGYYTDSTYDETQIVGDTSQSIPGLTRNINLIWKLCKNEKDLASVLAYFSKVTLLNPDTLKDYCFTEELTCTDMKSAFANVNWNNVKNFINADIDLQQNGTIINLGGNTSAGYDMIQEFESIYISQDIVERELTLLKGKISLTDAKSVIHSAIIDVLEKYYNIGYLIQTQYTGPNIYRNINGNNTCILSSGEVITGGYKIIILPQSAGADVHSFPEIEVIINTNKGIRYIKTTGVVL